MAKVGDVTNIGTISRERHVLLQPFFPVIERVVMVKGVLRSTQYVWDRRGKSFVIAVMRTGGGEFVLVREPKYGTMSKELGFPTGAKKKSEHVYAAASREAAEESGYRASEWTVLRSGIIDFADKVDGGEHFILFGDGAERVKEPEEGTEVVLCTHAELEGLLDGRGSHLGTINIAMQISAAYLAMMHIEKSP